MKSKPTLFWVLGDHIKGFDIRTKKPRTKFVPEPFTSMLAAQKFISYQILINA